MARDKDAERKPTLEQVNGVWRLKRVSPSQIKTFNLCELKWFLEKKLKHPKKPPGKGVQIGLDAHGRMEHFLITGDDVRGTLERTGASMIEPYLWAAPFNKGGGMVEAAVDQPTIRTDSGIEIVGFIDYAIPPSSNGPATIVDHKFRKDIDRYAEKGCKEIELDGNGHVCGSDGACELSTDPQGVIYCFWAMHKWKVGRVKFAHHNYQTQNRRFAEERFHIFNAGELDSEWSKLQATIARIDDCAQVEDALKVNYNPDACGAFGGCDFAKICPRSPVATLIDNLFSPQTTDGNNMGLLDGMNAALAGIQTTPATPAASAPAASAAPTDKRPKFKIIEASECVEGKPYRQPGTEDVLEFQAKTSTHVFFQNAAGAPVRLVLACLLEDMSAPRHPGMQIVDVSTDAAPASTGAVGVKPADAPAPTPSLTSMVSTPAASVSAPVTTADTEPSSVAAADDKPKRGRKPKGDVPAGDLTGLVLCINCAPSKPHADLSAWVADMAANLATAGKCEEIRFAPKDHPFAYGGWKGALAKKAIENAPTGLCVIYRSELTEPVIEALAGIATLVIRG